MAVRTCFFVAGICLALAGPSFAQHGEQHLHRSFDDAAKWSKIFDDPGRDAWQKPAEVIRALKLPHDAAVADIGSGTGYFAVRLARALPKGRVYGADIAPDMVKFLNERAAKEKLPNLSSHLAGESDPKLPAPVDLVLVVDTYHHIPRRVAYFTELKKVLKPSARVAIIDFRKGAPDGPPEEFRLTPDQISEELGKAGFALQTQHDFLPRQNYLVYRAK